ncbi:MAG: hypothetical protein IPI67_27805 [Myxococcales bacterium]|nr:hypothetical protein [Myxococcales bacterium]
MPRPPFVEDRGLGLVDETLTLTVEDDGSVRVAALFHFVASGELRDRVATFPIGAPRGPAREFRAELVGSGRVPVPTARGAPGGLPMGDFVESWDIWLSGEDLARHDGWLLVRYVQTGNSDFGYVLKSGAYWRGPIGRLRVEVEDPHARLAEVILEGERIEPRGRRRLSLELRDVEPADGVILRFR